MSALNHSAASHELVDGLGVPLAEPRVALSAASLPAGQAGPRSFLAVGFPLQSLTRNTGYGLLIMAIITFMSCQNAKPFDKEGWAQYFDGDYPQRNAMIDDLLRSHELKGEPLHSVIDLLGKPDNVELVERPNTIGKEYITYQVLVDFGWNIDPVHTKYLVVDFDTDSIVTATQIHEWKQK